MHVSDRKFCKYYPHILTNENLQNRNRLFKIHLNYKIQYNESKKHNGVDLYSASPL